MMTSPGIRNPLFSPPLLAALELLQPSHDPRLIEGLLRRAALRTPSHSPSC